MKKLQVLICSGALLAGAAWAADTHQHQGADPRVEASRNAVKELQGALVTELQAAMKAGGPVNAIEVCHKRAAEIAAGISAKHGWKVGRTSLKHRNPGSAPDAWEKQVMQDFEKRKAAGEDPAKLEHHEIVGKEFRYMKALPVPADMPCLKCHGEQLDPAVQARLKELYPGDKATGYKTGDLRGAVTIRQPL